MKLEDKPIIGKGNYDDDDVNSLLNSDNDSKPQFEVVQRWNITWRKQNGSTKNGASSFKMCAYDCSGVKAMYGAKRTAKDQEEERKRDV